MRKYLHILSAAMLMVYGTLTLVIVPLHHHSDENLSAVNSRSASVVHISSEKSTINVSSKDCDVCVFSHITFILHSSASSFTFESVKENQFAPVSEFRSLDFLSSHPHRGPPAFHS